MADDETGSIERKSQGMTGEESRDRRDAWCPPKRPDWVERVNAEGRHFNLKSVVPLDENSLIEHAKANTGLSDFGEDDWREPFAMFVKALDAESNLTLMGRLITRSDLLLYLEARLNIAETYRRHPEIEDERIVRPLYIIGQGRTGTSEMHRLLAADPNNRVFLNWEVMLPCPPPEAATYRTDPRIDKIEALQGMYYRVTPEMRGVFDYGGDVPCENVHPQCLSFRSPAYMNANIGQVPSFVAYMAKQDPVLAHEYEKRLAKLLQWRNPGRQWVFKSPYAMVELPTVLKVYPDVNFVMPTRDPIKALSSAVGLIGTLNWVRSDEVFIGGSLAQFLDPSGSAAMLNQVVDWLEDGSVPRDQFMAMSFQQFISDRMASAEAIYRRFDIELTPEGRAGMQAYIDANHRETRPIHRYDTGSADLVSAERAMFKRYQDYFSIPSEV